MNPDIPNAAGSSWFESLRPHISETGEAADYRNAIELRLDSDVMAILSLEIGRIEREWLDESKA